MSIFETQEQVDKGIAALKDYQAAVKTRDKANQIVGDKLGALKTITGVVGNDYKAIEEEVLRMLGQVTLTGLPEQRGR